MEKYLSFSRGRPIAKITGGANNNKVVGLVCNHDVVADAKDDTKTMKSGKFEHLDIKELAKEDPDLVNILKKIDKYEHNVLMGKLLSIKKKEADIHVESIIDNKAKFNYVPNTETRDCIYICGPSGSGKSYWCRMYIMIFKKMFPEYKVYLFSTKPIDEQLDSLGVVRIPINDKILELDIDYTTFANSLCIFDDVDSLESKKDIARIVWGLRDTLLDNGRSQNTYMLNTIHQMFGYRSTRTCLNESQLVVFFPGMGSDKYIRKYLDENAGLEKAEISSIMKLPSRWVAIYTHNPRFILWEHGVKLL